VSVVHFLNVKEGDCSIINHVSGHISVIDVSNARKEYTEEENISAMIKALFEARVSGSGNFNQKAYPVNPIEYMKSFGITSIFRFILTHPDMDHMDGIKDLFEEFNPVNFHDTNNKKEIEFDENSVYCEEDWHFYKKLRDSNPQEGPKRLTTFSSADIPYLTKDWNGNPLGDALYILSPTPELVEEANETEDFNDCSYVILYKGFGGDVLFSGDAYDKTRNHVVSNHKNLIKDIDLLIAPHHGRKSDRDYSFLDVINPKMTFFGNARAEDLAYSAWNYRNLPYITNNQTNNCMVVDMNDINMPIYVTNKKFAEQENFLTIFNDKFKAWFLKNIR
jgi:beta-lactamase superfamily II metal-dependent hydrolase